MILGFTMAPFHDTKGMTVALERMRGLADDSALVANGRPKRRNAEMDGLQEDQLAEDVRIVAFTVS